MKVILVTTLVILVGAVVYFAFNRQSLQSSIEITNFDQCALAGYPVGESYPRQCWTPEGGHFIEEIISG